jgi:Leucine-rich repeat (LRR) protein
MLNNVLKISGLSVWLLVALSGSSNAQCIIQDEKCFCGLKYEYYWYDFYSDYYALECKSLSLEKRDFPSSQLQAEFIKSKSGTKKLSINNKNYERLPALAFGNVSYASVDLSQNNISGIDSNCFRGAKIESLYFDYTDLDDLNFIVNLPTLKYFYFRYNRIRAIEVGTFLHPNKLTWLNLNNNKLNFVKNYTFFGLISLEYLDLSENEIAEIGVDSFRENRNLKMLNLVKNRIKYLYRGSFNGLSLISWNMLDLSRQNMEHLNSNCFQGLTSLAVLTLKFNRIRTMSSRAFEGLESLTSLDLHFNDFTVIESETFYGLKSIRELKLDKLKIAYLKERSFSGMEKLETLDLNYNNIKTVPNKTFGGLHKLKLLNLGDCMIETLEIDCFYGLENVISIDLSLNRFTNVACFRFNSTRMLETLDLSNNLIKNLTECEFSGLEKRLLSLSLSINKLDFIKKYHFKNLFALKNLNLSRNTLVSIELGSFDDLKQLNELDLSFNCLFKIHKNLFYNLNNLKILNLRANVIKSLSLTSLKSQNQLTHLIFSGNLIENFNLISPETLPSLTFVDIRYNSLLKIIFLNTKFTTLNINGNSQANLTIANVINPQLKALYAKSLNLEALKNINFTLFANIEELDLSLVNLDGLTRIFNSLNVNLKRLWIQVSIINSNLAFLNRFKNLLELDLSSVQGIGWGNETVLNSMSQLETLRMSRLNLSSRILEKNLILDKYTNLVYLDLSNNSLEYFNITLKSYRLKTVILANNYLKLFDFDKVFYSTYQACSLIDLSFNQITDLVYTRKLTFEKCSVSVSSNNISKIGNDLIIYFLDSEKLNLSSNRLNRMNKNVKDDEVFIKIQHLDLSSNRLKNMGNIFTSRTYNMSFPLLSLDLSSNRFESLDFNFDNLVNLKHLYLSRNRISYLNEDTFSSLIILAELDISCNNLNRIESNTFKSLDSLEFLNISSNPLESIFQDQFVSLGNLADLDASNDSIEYFHANTFANLINLKNLFIHMNRLKFIEKLVGLSFIKNIYLDLYLIISNPTNVVNLKESIRIKFHKKSRGISYLKSVNVITYPPMLETMTSNEYCSAEMFLIKYNISLNLKTDRDFDYFIGSCEQFSHENMFIESDLHF